MKNNAVSIKRWLLLLFAGLILLVALLTRIRPAASDAHLYQEDLLGRFEHEIPQLLINYHVPGAAVTYLQDGKIVFSKGYGITNRIFPAAVNEHTVFQVASLSKPVAAYLTLKFANEGKIDLDQPVADYLQEPWIKDGPWAKQITVRQLLTHMSGLSNSVFPVDTVVHFEPGTKFSYSGVGYMYLTKIIEGVTGRSFDAVASEMVFTPLGMSASTFNMPFLMVGNAALPHVDLSTVLLYCLAPFLLFVLIVYLLGLLTGWLTHFRYYSKAALFKASMGFGFGLECLLLWVVIPKLIVPALVTGLIFTLLMLLANWITKRFVPSVFIALGLIAAAGLLIPAQVPFDMVPAGASAAYSLNTTSQDLGNFAAALLAMDTSSSAGINGMLTHQVTVDEQTAWGLGMGIEKDPGGTTYWHSGINPGTRALMVIDPKTQTGVVILTNGENGLELARQVAAMVFGYSGKWDVRSSLSPD